jgi:hypothetical protein
MARRRTRRKGGTCNLGNSTIAGGGRKRRQKGGFGLDGTILSTALVPISLVLANQYWPGTMSRFQGKKGRRGGKTKRHRRRRRSK